ncbi:hypothetical protein M408DRAFT_26410 [Serendipita vermifera MAFF 305830]|uniref:Sec63-domain-containing protein n=1 Tax=Serendipita vermifera MAFF 305830 TaxID=933852 RepID=A0A0C3AKX0_SERVB|nr:hypothetical protein M408DRAFT_26410 [Serendipita vermifera MAFF 305830]
MSLNDHLKSLFHASDPAEKTLNDEIAALERWSSIQTVQASSISHLELPSQGIDATDSSYQSEALERLLLLDIADTDIHVPERDDSHALLEHPSFLEHRKELLNLLASRKSDEEISGELAELVGYDELDFVASMVQNRHLLVDMDDGKATPRHRAKKGKGKFGHDANDFSEGAVKRRLAEGLQAAADRPLWTGTARAAAEVLPHVYTSASMTNNHAFAGFASKYMLPLGTTRQMYEDYEEVILPPAKTVPPRASERLIPCSELPPLAKGSFGGYTHLNRIQSIVYPTAFKTNENMLICAPTGAGKTDVAMLTILRTVEMHRSSGGGDIASTVRHADFKIIYVAPMKALASEITRKLGKRLAWLKIMVRELTGDMQLTKAEIAETQIIVTTPEKWDVVTRKPTGEGELATKVKLLIIDEVHLLNEERGAVIETIVARTIRQVESTQSLIRVVGLSATLPNYIDVADFLRVSRHQGLFFFDSSFRPVPLEQHFLGIKGKAGSPAAKRALDKSTYHLVSELVRDGHQVMVFVHSRKDTVKGAESIKEIATLEGELEIFGCQEHPQFEFYRRDIGKSRNKEMKQLFDVGFGIHHAGMLRPDRNMMERLFEAKVIKASVLFCTATLAWGVNLPAHGVVIKGTQLYDPSQGKFVDLSVLDVLQIFGRAGRPGMESSGVGYICTSEDRLQHYLEAVTSQHPIESKFNHGLLDSLNAEISLGTVTNVSEGAEWLGYTYLFVRMRKNPLVYGMTHEDPINDPDLTERRHSMIIFAGRKLAAAGMVQFDEAKSTFVITDIGRIAAKYYIRHASIEVFQERFRPRMTEADVLALLAMSTEFDQIQVRENEVDELKALEEIIPCQVKGGTDTSAGKVNILLQAYISKFTVEDFALVSDTMYAAQNGGRIVRSLLEIALSRKWANASAVLMSLSISVEKRMWGYEHPLAQFDLSADLLYNLKQWADETQVYDLKAKSAAELGVLVHLNERHGAALLRAAKQLPAVTILAKLRPLSHELLRIHLNIERSFEWSAKIHGSAEPFWVWVEDHSGLTILQLARIAVGTGTESLQLDFIIPLPAVPPPSVTIRAMSDRWLGAEEEVHVPFDNLIMPPIPVRRTSLLDLPLLKTDMYIFDERTKRLVSRFTHFNSIQTQCLWPAYNTNRNMVISASTSSGKSLIGEVAICRTLRTIKSPQWIMIVVPRLDSARTLALQLREALGMKVGLAQQPQDIENRHVQVWIITSSCLMRLFVQDSSKKALLDLQLVICEDLELLDDTYELGLSLLLRNTQAKPVRMIGLAAALEDAEALADWLGVPSDGFYCFPATERDQALSVTFQTFTIPYSAALMKAMAKPVYDSIHHLPITESAIVFVPSASQCRSVVAELVTQCALGMNLRGFLGEGVSQDILEGHISFLRNTDLVDGVMRGFGIWHDRMHQADKILMLRLFVKGIIRVLVIPRELCWSVPVRAGLVIAMGTQYAVGGYSGPEGGSKRSNQYATGGNSGPKGDNKRADQHATGGHSAPEGGNKRSDQYAVGGHSGPEGGKKRPERRVLDYSLHELVRMQGRAVRHGKTGRFHILCQAEHRETYMRFFTDGLPLESQLLGDDDAETFGSDVFKEWLKAQRANGAIKSRQDILDFFSLTLLMRRAEKNPSYYDVAGDRATYFSRVVDSLWDQTTPQAGPAIKDARSNDLQGEAGEK